MEFNVNGLGFKMETYIPDAALQLTHGSFLFNRAKQNYGIIELVRSLWDSPSFSLYR